MSQIKITEYSQTIPFPINNIWAILSAFGSEKLWMPDCISSSLEGFGIGATRTIRFGSAPDVEIVETIVEVDAVKHCFRFKVLRTDWPGIVSYGTAILDVVGEKETRFTWIAESEFVGEGAKESMDEMYRRLTEAIATKLAM